MCEDVALSNARSEEGQGEDEEGRGQIDGVKVGQADHQTVEGVQLVLVSGEDDDEANVAKDANDGNNKEEDSFNIEFEGF